MFRLNFLARVALVLGILAGAPATFGAAKVIILTPHVDAIRHEFARGFAAWHREQFGEPAEVEWRNVGGTSDALRFIQSEFKNKPGGIGLDMFFGGGQEPYLLLAEKQLAERYEPPRQILAGIPQNVKGMDIYDAGYVWFGAALSGFGILQNKLVQRTVGLPLVTTWGELTNAALFGWVGAGDPRKSGTMVVMFESFLQYYGWERAWQILAQIGGNVRKFDLVSSTTAKDVTLGETAYAFAIEFYGFTQVAVAGESNMAFTVPADFTAVNPDGIAILKGAPNRETARRFIDYVLSEAGQRLWFLPKTHPDGPKQFSIDRLSIRPDFYVRYRDARPRVLNPFDQEQGFIYDAKLGRRRRDVVAAMLGAVLVDSHSELKSAWRRIISRQRPDADLRELGRTPITETEALALTTGAWTNAEARVHSNIVWQSWARAKYRRLATADSR